MRTQHCASPGTHFVICRHINHRNIVWFPQLSANLRDFFLGPPTTHDGMSPSPELLRHRTPQSARHAGDHDNFLPVHQAETFRAESHVSSREFSLELLNELPVFRERASLKKIFK